MKQFKTAKQFFLFILSMVSVFTVHAKKLELTASVVKANMFLTDTVPQSLMRSNSDEDTAIENRLVQLALAQPLFKQTESQNKILDYQLRKQRNSWLNLLSLSTSYNDQSFAKPTNVGNTAYVYPKYFFGLTIPIGLIVSNGTDIKITKESKLIAEEQKAEQAKTIRASVLSNYKQYKAGEKLLAIQNQVVDDEQANFLQVEEKFKDGTTTLDLYNDASKKYNDEQVKVINLQLQQDLIKLELERLIGMRLEDALK